MFTIFLFKDIVSINLNRKGSICQDCGGLNAYLNTFLLYTFILFVFL